jgi:hypothetical protein
VLVIADGPHPEVVMNEWVEPEHVRSDHSASQLIERLAWGVEDAANAEKRLQDLVGPERLSKNARVRSYLEVPE